MERMYLVVRHDADFPSAVSDCWEAVRAVLTDAPAGHLQAWFQSEAGKVALRARPAQWASLTDEVPSVTIGCVRAYTPVEAPDARFRKLQAHSPATRLVLPGHEGPIRVLLNQSLSLSSGKWLAHVGHAAQASLELEGAPSFSWKTERVLRSQEGGQLIEDAGHTEIKPGTATVWVGY